MKHVKNSEVKEQQRKNYVLSVITAVSLQSLSNILLTVANNSYGRKGL